MEEFVYRADALLEQIINGLTAIGRAFAGFGLDGRAWIALAVALALGVIIGALLGRRRAPAGIRAATQPATARQEPRVADPEEALRQGLQRALSAKGVAVDALEGAVADALSRVREIRDGMMMLKPDDDEIAGLLDEAKRAFATGELRRAVNLLFGAGERAVARADEADKTAAARRLAAAQALTLVGDLELVQLEHENAAESFRRAIDALPAGHDELLADCLEKQGTAAYRIGDHAGAGAAFERAIAVVERLRGAEHVELAPLLNNLALVHFVRGDLAAAEPLYRRALRIDEKALGADHPNVATDLNNLGLLYKKQGNFKAAEPVFKRSLAVKEKAFGRGHPSLLTGYRNYASLLRAMDRVREAEAMEARAEVSAAEEREATQATGQQKAAQ